jgi:Ca2+-binding EF-hand superfamily protein
MRKMKSTFKFVMLLTTIFGASMAALAQDIPLPPGGGPPPGGMQQMRFQMPNFADLDKNKDKKLSKDELSQFPPQMVDRLDENKDGFIDETEWNNAQRRFGGGGGGPRMGEMLTKFMDGNGDGKISRDEFAKIATLFDGLDKDKNGELTMEESNEFFRAVNQAVSEAQSQTTGGVNVTQLFTNLDKNKDGKITADEMTNEKAFKALDLNSDGSVTKEEATESLKKQAERKQKSSPSQN